MSSSDSSLIEAAGVWSTTSENVRLKVPRPPETPGPPAWFAQALKGIEREEARDVKEWKP